MTISRSRRSGRPAPRVVSSPATLLAAALLGVAVVLGGCSRSPAPSEPTPTTEPSARAPVAAPTPEPRRELASDPVQLADDLVADERALRDPASPESVLTAAAHRQQAAYRALGRHPEWDPIARPRIPAELREIYDLNVAARRHLTALSEGTAQDTLPAWRIVDPTPADELMRYYREAESATGVGWQYLAAINFVETAFGRIAGVSTAGAQGPMQFLPSTFAAYGEGGDINSPRDAILAAGRYLAANGFATDRAHALWRYNNSDHYVRAVEAYAAAMAADPAAFPTYHRWQVYYKTTVGDVLLPVGYQAGERVSVTSYLAAQGKPVAELSPGSEQRLDRLLTVTRRTTDPVSRSESLSREFLGTPYRANTLIGSADVPEQLVANLEQVDCFTFADYVEAAKRATTREEFFAALTEVRYRDGAVSFANRKHFFTDWAATSPPVATDITASLSPDAVAVHKQLNQKDSGGWYLPGLPVVARTVSYLPSDRVDDSVLAGLRTGDYLGAYATDGGLDVTHVGIVVNTPQGPVLRNASSLPADMRVVDTPLREYLGTVPGVVVLRPLR